MSDLRHRPLSRARFAIYLIAREHGYSFTQIGTFIGRDHSTIVHGTQAIVRLMADDLTYRAFVDTLREQAASYVPYERITLPEALKPEQPYVPPAIAVPPQLKVKNHRLAKCECRHFGIWSHVQ